MVILLREDIEVIIYHGASGVATPPEHNLKCQEIPKSWSPLEVAMKALPPCFLGADD